MDISERLKEAVVSSNVDFNKYMLLDKKKVQAILDDLEAEQPKEPEFKLCEGDAEMTNNTELLPCPCGEIPKALIISDAGQGGKYAIASGDCCGGWDIEFRTDYYALDSDECMKLAIEAWNEAPRNQRQPEWVSVLDELPEIDGSYLCHFSDGVIETFGYSTHEYSCKPWGVGKDFVTHWQTLPPPPQQED